MRSLKSPEAVAAYINLLAAIVTLIAACASQHDEPAGTTQQIVVNTNTTNVTNEPSFSASSSTPTHIRTRTTYQARLIGHWRARGAARPNSSRGNAAHTRCPNGHPSAPVRFGGSSGMSVGGHGLRTGVSVRFGHRLGLRGTSDLR